MRGERPRTRPIPPAGPPAGAPDGGGVSRSCPGWPQPGWSRGARTRRRCCCPASSVTWGWPLSSERRWRPSCGSPRPFARVSTTRCSACCVSASSPPGRPLELRSGDPPRGFLHPPRHGPGRADVDRWSVPRAGLLGLSGALPLLIAVGTAICGNSAIIATAPALDADERDVSFAVATITLVGLVAVVLYPVLGVTLGLTDTGYGMWAGTAIGDTSQVVAAGFGYTAGAGGIATIVKLTRNVLIAPVVLGAGLLASSGASHRSAGSGRKAFPLFVLGFLAVAAAASLGALEPAAAGRTLRGWVVLLREVCILVALAGVGACHRPLCDPENRAEARVPRLPAGGRAEHDQPAGSGRAGPRVMTTSGCCPGAAGVPTRRGDVEPR
ncbi:MAG: putative sulfate exporter family transporter [Nitriliruptorales bacterium]|nr:putative sulfate exporter family transporter [Nitriliruptorales bacterium]